MNLYFYITKNSDGSITLNSEEQRLPITFLNVSGFNVLEFSDPQSLPDLSWLGRPELGFWLAIIGTKPSILFHEKLVKSNTINIESKTVSVFYTVVGLTSEEVSMKQNNIKTRYAPIRDSYLKLTDFTQLKDAPISEQAENDFSIFRKQLRTMFDINDYSQLTWPLIPTSASNIDIPPFPEINLN
jgi:hypothetical protein